jgi:DNA mismatch repair protein MutS2
MTITDHVIGTLEFSKVRERLARYTSFAASRELALALSPTTDQFEVERRQRLTSEACLFQEQHPDVGVGAARDIRPLVEHAARGGTIEASDLLNVLQTLASMRVLRLWLLKLDAEHFPLLREYAVDLPDLHAIEQHIERTIEEDGRVRDAASATLSRLRNQIRTASARLQDKLRSLVGQFASALQEPIVTMRYGRYVVPVKAEKRRMVPGLVHDQSGSGATLYIEPMVVVELNNHLRELELSEQQEVARILAQLSQQIGHESVAVCAGVAALAALDLLLAQATYSHVLRAVQPTFTSRTDSADYPPLYLKQARHPLLDPQTVVPIDVWMGDEFQLLLITGPNTGGKTVALKTVGLLVLMAQAGLHVPTQSPARLPLFGQVFADIGDEQSIEQSLSTFSSHMRNIIRMLEQIEQRREPLPSLVLLDEIGAGTDPSEGAALARAIIERLLERGCMGIITTHYAELKAFAHNTPGLQNASVEFDSETLAPIYRMTIGVPGRSNALAIAQRLGLDPLLVERARSTTSSETVHIEKLLEDIHRKSEAITEELQRTEALRTDAEKYRDRLSRELQLFEERRQEHMQDALREVDEELREIREHLRRTRETIPSGAQAQPPAQPPAQTVEHQVQAVQQQMRAVYKKASQRVIDSSQAASGGGGEETPRPLQVGDTVLVRAIGLSGEIVVLDEDEQSAEVQVGNFRVNADLSELRREKSNQDERRQKFSATRAISVPVVPDVPLTLDMRGWRTSDVNDELERYLNDAYLSGLPHVRLVHGKGTGALRQVVHSLLRTHPLVHSFSSGGKDGGDGVTVARLVEK